MQIIEFNTAVKDVLAIVECVIIYCEKKQLNKENVKKYLIK